MIPDKHEKGCNYGVPGRGWYCSCPPAPPLTDAEWLKQASTGGPDPKIVYVAHPVGGDVLGNTLRTERWLRWLIDTMPGIVWVCPWLPYLDVLIDAEPEHRTWAMWADAAMVKRCDAIVLVGGRVSAGMAFEADTASKAGLRVLDWTYLGAEPPDGGWSPKPEVSP